MTPHYKLTPDLSEASELSPRQIDRLCTAINGDRGSLIAQPYKGRHVVVSSIHDETYQEYVTGVWEGEE